MLCVRMLTRVNGKIRKTARRGVRDEERVAVGGGWQRAGSIDG